MVYQEGVTLQDAVRRLADLTEHNFEKAVRAGKVGLVGYVFQLQPRELAKLVKAERWRRIRLEVWNGQKPKASTAPA